MHDLARAYGALAALFLSVFGMASAPADLGRNSGGALRVCADPNNLPFSNVNRQGFENTLAELVARDLKKRVDYFWVPERANFIKGSLNAGRCDLVMGVPAGWDEVESTRSYYASSYVFVYRADRKLQLRSLKDPQLKRLKIGVHLLGDDDTPPMQALGRQGIVKNVVGFMIYGDYGKPNPPARLIEAVESRAVDVAAVWGPLGGYFARHSSSALEVVPIEDTAEFAPFPFRYQMAIGVRKGDHALKDAVDRVIARRGGEIRNLLKRYGVPLVSMGQGG